MKAPQKTSPMVSSPIKRTHILLKAIFRKTACAAAAVMVLWCAPATTAQTPVTVWHNESADTTRITHILIEEARADRPGEPGRLGQLFAGTPYAAHTLEGENEALRVNLDSMDCTTFVETVAALALTAREGRSSWQDFLYNLERIRYRQGTIRDYASRLHYISDWALDNQSRGTLREVTGELPGARHNVKTLNFMTRNRALYPALADSATYARMRSVEAGFSNYRYPYLRGSSLNAKNLRQLIRQGDILAFTTATPGLDVSHLGIAVTDADGTVRLLHASSREGKVLIDPLPLAEYLRRNRTDGLRVFRLLE